MESGIQITGIEVPGQVEGWWVMDNGVEGFVREGRCQVTAVTNQLLDPGIGEQFLRPGIGPANLNDDGIKFDGDHLFGGLGCQDCGITQAGGCIQYQPLAFPALSTFGGIFHGVGAFDAVHRDAGDQHGGGGLGGHQAVIAIGEGREELHFAELIIF